MFRGVGRAFSNDMVIGKKSDKALRDHLGSVHSSIAVGVGFLSYVITSKVVPTHH